MGSYHDNVIARRIVFREALDLFRDAAAPILRFTVDMADQGASAEPGSDAAYFVLDLIERIFSLCDEDCLTLRAA